MLQNRADVKSCRGFLWRVYRNRKNPMVADINFTVFNRHATGIAFSANTVSKRIRDAKIYLKSFLLKNLRIFDKLRLTFTGAYYIL